MMTLSLYLNEQYGLSEEVRRISSDIIAKYIKKDKQPLKLSFNGVFVNEIIFTYVNNTQTSGSYDPYATSFEDKKIYIELKYNFENPNYKSIYDILVHELTHAVEDINGSIKLKRLIDNCYNVASNYIVNKNYGDKLTSNMNIFMYIFNSNERNAYMSQLYGDIEEIIRKKSWTRENINLKELVDELKKNNIWSVYFNCGLWIDSISNNETLQEIIEYKYNKLCNTNKTYNQIIKLMKTQYNKFKKKFDSYVPKITFEILYNNEQKLSKK